MRGNTNAEAPPEPGAGDVAITLCGQELMLQPSLEACMRISKMAGDSLAVAVQKVGRYDFDFIVELIALGVGATTPALKKEVQEKVYRTGVIHLVPECILFIRTIMNGGVLPNDEEEPGGEDGGPLGASPSQSENSTDA